MEKDMSKEEAIKFFREFIAEKEGLSQEDAGAEINSTIGPALDILDPLHDLAKAITKIGADDPKRGIISLITSIEMLLETIPAKHRDIVLLDIIKKSDKIGNIKARMNEEVAEYLKKKRGV